MYFSSCYLRDGKTYISQGLGFFFFKKRSLKHLCEILIIQGRSHPKLLTDCLLYAPQRESLNGDSTNKMMSDE